VNEKINYVKIENEKKKYWIAEKRLNEIAGDYKILEKKVGKQLEGIKYEMPYASLSVQENSPHKVVVWELASEEEGTGIVHIAPGCGAEDYILGKKLKLPAISPLDEAGVYKKDYSEFSLKNYKEVNKFVLEDLKKQEFVYKTTPYNHRYPHCWRCGEELVFRLVDEWYIKSKEIRDKLISENKKIRWYPEYGKVRQEDWFENMGDWLISRKRYWGLPLPIWECECGEIEVIGSLEELKKRAINKDKVDKLPELHRPWIDEIKIKCSRCKKEVSRVVDVGDAWLDAGIVPFSTLDYLTDKKYWKEWFPTDLISENMPGQYRGWFNALFWASVALEGKAPFKAMFGYETLKDEKGEEMHKSKGNTIWFDDALEKIGADAMRLLYCLQDPSQELRFGFNVAKDPINQINILYNISKLIEDVDLKKISRIEDRWILSRLNSLVKTFTDELENLHPHLATRALRDFWIYDFSRGYIQIIRERISNEDKEALGVLKMVYLTMIKLCAPIIPFITEKIWQDLIDKKIVKEESVHLCSWPIAEKKMIDLELEQEMEVALKIIEAGMAARDKVQIGLKWPLAKAIVSGKDIDINKELIEIVKSQLNVKKLEIKDGDELKVELDTNLTPELEAEGYARELSRHIQAFRKQLGLEKKQMIKTIIITDESLKKILENQKKFVEERTNSKSLEIVTTNKERFKNKMDFRIKDKRGEIVIIH